MSRRPHRPHSAQPPTDRRSSLGQWKQTMKATAKTAACVLLAACSISSQDELPAGSAVPSAAGTPPVSQISTLQPAPAETIEGLTDAATTLASSLRPAVLFGPKTSEPVERQTREELGSFKMTYYWVAAETTRRPATEAIYDKTCKRIAKVSKSFHRRLALEGSGRLRDGRMVNTAGRCKCGPPCYWVADEEHPWGAGVLERPLDPFRSVAVDTKVIPIGTKLYIRELDGLTMPGAGDEGGFVHDGCVVADDVGGGVRGKQLDFFAARRRHYRSFFQRHKLNQVRVYAAGPHCNESRPAPAVDPASDESTPPALASTGSGSST